MRRRELLAGGASLGLLACVRGPSIKSRAPAITHGVQAGDVGGGAATIWARCDEPARLVVEWGTTGAFEHRVAGAIVGPDRDRAGTATLAGLPDGQTITYRARFEREAARGASPWVTGTFVTPRAERIRLVWSGDTCGQGFGRNPEWGGMRGYAAIRDARPDFFLHSGDLIYGDGPILAEAPQPDGRIWKNVTNERVARVAQSLDDFRARFQYNLEDEHVRALAATCPIVAQWDDHETHDNWWPGEQLDDPRYTRVRDASTLASWARQAMFEWTPISGTSIHRVIHYGPLLDVVVVDLRSYRTPNDANRGTTGAMLGAAQAAWLVDALATSRARWKIVACDQPLSLVIDGPDHQEGFANGAGPPLGRELELAGVLAELQRRGVGNVVWLTADVHYATARANGATFDPFWEFVAGPIHAGTYGPNELDPTFGPEVRFQWAPPPGREKLAPWEGLQSFGTVDITADAMTVGLSGIDGRQRFTTTIARR